MIPEANYSTVDTSCPTTHCPHLLDNAVQISSHTPPPAINTRM